MNTRKTTTQFTPARACFALLAALCFASLSAQAQLVIEITKGEANATPVAIVPFATNGVPVELDVAAVVDADLTRSGRFAPIDRADMLARPSSGTEVDFGDWRLLGVDAIVVGRLARGNEDTVQIEFEVFDVVRAQQLLAYRIVAERAQLRTAAHLVADQVYEALTGTAGVFATRIAYITKDGGPGSERYRLFVADADGENALAVFDSPAPIMSPSWSPAGHRLAFVSFQDDRSAIYVQELATGEQTRVSSRQGVNSAPAWSPDGNKLALALSDGNGDLDIHVLNVATQELQQVTRSRGIDTEPVWSRDGRTLYFTSDRAGGPQIYRADVYSGKTERVTFEGAYNARPRLSPDESRLAMVHNDGGNYRIAVLDLRSRALQVLTDGRLDESPSFAPNGSMIIYATQDEGAGVLAAVAVDGSVQQRLASQGRDVREPVWGPLAARR
ncbi:MAG: Tol-Pal system beta propeller repeat protein TolB [Pseudomonadota bacterium]